MDTPLVRMIDASINRATEGLRVVEDFARFLLDDPHLTALTKDLRHELTAALAAIPARYRQAIELRLIEELPREACARRMDVTTATFDVVLYRAVRAFRKQFGDREQA